MGEWKMAEAPEWRPSPKGRKTRIAAILAGGRSRRMGGEDKARAMLAGARLIDRVIERLRPQADLLVISGADDYATGLDCVADRPGAPQGPAGGVFAIERWLRRHAPGAEAFFTVPVDGPFAPADLIERLAAAGGPAIASDGAHDHPTFACWRLDALDAAWPQLAGLPSVSLTALAGACGAARVVWDAPDAFLNLNTPEDFARAGRLLAGGAGAACAN